LEFAAKYNSEVPTKSKLAFAAVFSAFPTIPSFNFAGHKQTPYHKNLEKQTLI
jgi:hypothetical protein